MKLNIKVTPGSSKDSVIGWLGDTLKISVKAAPEKGKANKAVEAALARTLGISLNDVKILQGHSSARKLVEISGLSDSEIHEKLEV